MKKSYVYKITFLVTGEYYFGSSFYAKRDSYWGSGRRIKDRIALFGKENFIKEILGEFDDRVEAHKVENEYIEKFRHDEKCLNKRLEHQFGLYGEESRAKISDALLGEKNHNFGKHFSEETRARMSAAKLGEKGPWYGKHLSKETRTKISAVHIGKHWRKNPVTGKREWYD